MDDEEFDLFMQQSYEEWEQKQEYLTKTYRLGKGGDYAYDTPSGELKFMDKAGKLRVQAATIPLGSYSAKSGTWQWAWANKSNPPAVRKQAEKLKELFKRTGMDVFKMPTIEIDEPMVWELVAMCVSHLEAEGSYAMPAGQLTVLVAIMEIEKAAK
jgi:hypothetical protein